jgi:hypothetical protein
MLRRAVLTALAIVLLMCAAVPAQAGPRRHVERHVARVSVSAEGTGTLIAVTYKTGAREHVRFLHTRTPIERVAVADIDNDGDLDVLATPRDGVLMLWRNAGHGRFRLATVPGRTSHLDVRRSRYERLQRSDDGGQWDDDRYEAAMPRGPDFVAAAPVALVRSASVVFVRPVSGRRSSGRAPPAA